MKVKTHEPLFGAHDRLPHGSVWGWISGQNEDEETSQLACSAVAFSQNQAGGSSAHGVLSCRLSFIHRYDHARRLFVCSPSEELRHPGWVLSASVLGIPASRALSYHVFIWVPRPRSVPGLKSETEHSTRRLKPWSYRANKRN